MPQSHRPLVLLFLLALTGCPTESTTCKTTTDCAKGRSCCDGKCLDTENDRNNCGACGAVCEFPNVVPSCKVGRCQFQCQAGFGNCNDVREDGCELRTIDSPDNCGVCGRVCMSTNASSVCAQSLCGLGTCSADFADCDMEPVNGCEIDTRIEANHCGACNQVCQLPHATSFCEASTCKVSGCDGGYGNCDLLDPNGCETVLPSDPLHCGRCNAACGPAQICVASQCRATELIIFGGALSFTMGNTTNDVFRFNLGANTYTQLNPATPDGPIPGRGSHVAAFDGPRNRMVVWGGIDGAGTLAPNDTWALDFAVVPPAWRKLVTTGTPPSPRFGPAAALDAANSKWYLYGGSTDLGTGLSELYVLDLATNSWSQVHGRNAAGAPGDRINAVAAFDPTAGAFVVFSGNHSGTRADLRELWHFDVVSRMWRTPPLSTGPVARAKGALFDGTPVYLFSGIASLLQAPASMVDDFYSLDVSATTPWTMQPALGPVGRFSAAHASRDGRLYVFGGGTTGASGQSEFRDLWSYDPVTQAWSRLHDGTGVVPTGKLTASMVGR
ncbi:MAG: kelch repeat-containing protein [Archangium sp.]|nr:kelch repeat-containing protein [Archangium sp.]